MIQHRGVRPVDMRSLANQDDAVDAGPLLYLQPLLMIIPYNNLCTIITIAFFFPSLFLTREQDETCRSVQGQTQNLAFLPAECRSATPSLHYSILCTITKVLYYYLPIIIVRAHQKGGRGPKSKAEKLAGIQFETSRLFVSQFPTYLNKATTSMNELFDKAS